MIIPPAELKSEKDRRLTSTHKDEEQYLVNLAVEVNKIGYGQTRRQRCEIVKKISDKGGRPNPFKDNRPGKDWWYAFLTRNNLTIRSPSSLEMYWASACTKQNLESWYARFKQFLSCHSLLDEPDRIWNCGESGFPLCPKSGWVLAPVGTKVVYSTCSAQKGQITTFVVICASGHTIPPMHIFPGKCFLYNPMEGGVDGAYFGRSDTGWMNTDHFWIKKITFLSRLGGRGLLYCW